MSEDNHHMHADRTSRPPQYARTRIEAPIIIIGAGGSGSSVLSRMLDAHPEITMLGEMYFLVPKSWYAFYQADANTIFRDIGSQLHADPELETRITSSFAEHDNFLKFLTLEEQKRTAAVLRQTIDAWFCLDRIPKSFWGFKEIWNGGFERHDWQIYDHVFPEAQWVHIMRHPLNHLHSAARLSGQILSIGNAVELANRWLGAVAMSRQRASTGRYCEIKYESLVSSPRKALGKLFERMGGIDWHDNCALPLTRQWGARSERQHLPDQILDQLARLPGLIPAMTELGYEWQEMDSDPRGMKRHVPVPSLEAISHNRWRLPGPFVPEQGVCWDVDLPHSAIGRELGGIADDVDQQRRSPLRLFEDDKPLSPAHSLHCWIRELGEGRYSHWQNRLLFSTSDNTNPNTNGRVYSFDLKG